MTRRRRLSAYLDALVAGRRPGGLRADAGDVEVVRAAIDLRAARPGDAAPDPEFVARLYDELAHEAAPPVAPAERPVLPRRRRAVMVSVAAGVVLVGGTVAVTEALEQPARAPAAVQAPHGGTVRTGTFETADRRVSGQVVAYYGNPSWVYMHVDLPHDDGTVVCTLQDKDGSTVTAGVFRLHDGVGTWSKSITVDIGDLRGARIVTTGGVTVATATFS